VFEAIKTSTAIAQRSDKSAKRSAEDVSYNRRESRTNSMHEAVVPTNRAPTGNTGMMTMAVTARLFKPIPNT
jgi:hypothetical protein